MHLHILHPTMSREKDTDAIRPIHPKPSHRLPHE